MIPACLWFIIRNKTCLHSARVNLPAQGAQVNRQGRVLFIDARKMGVMVDRRHRELTDEEIKKIAETYHAWRGENGFEYKDVPGFCKAATLDEIRKHDHILTPSCYVGTAEEEEDDEAFEEKMKRLTAELAKQMEEGKSLDEEIKKNLEIIGWEIE